MAESSRVPILSIFQCDRIFSQGAARSASRRRSFALCASTLVLPLAPCMSAARFALFSFQKRPGRM